MTLNPNATAISSEKISPASKHHPQSRCHINHRHRNINRRQSIRIYPTGNKNPVHGCIQVSNYFSPLFLFIFGAFFFTFSSRISANLVCTATATSNSASSTYRWLLPHTEAMAVSVSSQTPVILCLWKWSQSYALYFLHRKNSTFSYHAV